MGDTSETAAMSRKSRQSKGRKPRTDYIFGTTSDETSKVTIHVDPATGEIRFGQDMHNVYLERSYARPKGPKVVSRIPQAASGLSFDEAAALDNNFDHLFAVDTNTRLVGETLVSVVGVVTIAEVALRPGEQGRSWQFDVPFCLEYTGLRTKPEPFGWLEALGVLADEGHFTRGQRVGLVVDSELGTLHAYNARTLPVDTGRLLPPGVTLIYASADAGKENMINQALATADSAAGQAIAALEAGRAPMPSKPASSPLFDTVRIIEPNNMIGTPSARGGAL